MTWTPKWHKARPSSLSSNSRLLYRQSLLAAMKLLMILLKNSCWIFGLIEWKINFGIPNYEGFVIFFSKKKNLGDLSKNWDSLNKLQELLPSEFLIGKKNENNFICTVEKFNTIFCEANEILENLKSRKGGTKEWIAENKGLYIWMNNSLNCEAQLPKPRSTTTQTEKFRY